MRSSSGGCVEISAMKPLPPLIFIVASCGCESSTSPLFCGQALQRGDHVAAARQHRGAGVGAELARAREPGDDDHAEDAEDDVEDDRRDEEHQMPEMRSSTSWRTMLAMTREKKIENALTTPWTSVMVTMSPFWMCETSCARTPSISSRCIERIRPLDTATRLRALARAGGEGVDFRRVVDADFRHRQAGLARQLLDGLIEPVEIGMAGAAIDELDAHRGLGHPARHQQRDARRRRSPRPARTPSAPRS